MQGWDPHPLVEEPELCGEHGEGFCRGLCCLLSSSLTSESHPDLALEGASGWFKAGTAWVTHMQGPGPGPWGALTSSPWASHSPAGPAEHTLPSLSGQKMTQSPVPRGGQTVGKNGFLVLGAWWPRPRVCQWTLLL